MADFLPTRDIASSSNAIAIVKFSELSEDWVECSLAMQLQQN